MTNLTFDWLEFILHLGINDLNLQGHSKLLTPKLKFYAQITLHQSLH